MRGQMPGGALLVDWPFGEPVAVHGAFYILYTFREFGGWLYVLEEDKNFVPRGSKVKEMADNNSLFVETLGICFTLIL